MATNRVDPSIGIASPATIGLLLGDVAAITAFVLMGEIRHYPLGVALIRTPGTLIPFLVGWAVAAPLAGLFDDPIRRVGRRVGLRTSLAWVGATAIAMALRATPVFHGDADLTFAVVATVVGVVLLLPWRVVVAHHLGEGQSG